MSDAASHPAADPLRAAAQAQPDAPALLMPQGRRSYAALDRAVSATARRLRARGCREGERVALYMSRDERCLILILALLRCGAVACPLSTRQPCGALGPLLRAAGATRLLTNDACAMREALPDADVMDIADLVEWDGGREEAPGEAPPLPASRPATAVFTSGSTGAPKAALHSLSNHLYSAAGSNVNIPLRPGDRWLLSLPLYHVGGLAILFRCLLAGATVAVPAPEEALRGALERYRVTHVSLVATQLRRLLGDDEALSGARAERALRAVLLGGSAIPPALLDEVHSRGWPVHTSYGLTEMASQVATTPPGAAWALLRTSGRVLPYRRLRINAEGEILVKGETLFLGYLQGDRVERPVDAEGWFHTGDTGRLDEEGALHVTGRTDRLFISGGENIQPAEIEAVLERLPGVVQAAVVPVPDAAFGERPVAFVRGAGGDLPEGLAAQLAERLPGFKVPDAFYPWPEEAEAGMKVDRSLLSTLALERRAPNAS